MSESLDIVYDDVFLEHNRATKIHGRFNSAHEGYAVILEELDELWDEVKKREHDYKKMYNEAKQVAAMAIRFMDDLNHHFPG